MSHRTGIRSVCGERRAEKMAERFFAVSLFLAGLFFCGEIQGVPAGWASWRGVEGTGVSRETGYPETWSTDGLNLLWNVPYGGRSTPIVMNGRVYIINRAESGETEQERILCFDARTGDLKWQYRFNVWLTDISSNRVGWSSPVGDPETGNVYVHGVQGTFLCMDPDGKILWERSLHEEFGKISGYGGRTTTPVVDEDLVILSFLNSSWGPQAKGAHRYVAFEKRTGEVVWWSQPGGKPLDTTYTAPVVAVVGGVRLLIDGGADGAVHAMKIRTGEPVWKFQLSKRGLNSSVVFKDNHVFACHSEENMDDTAMGRVVCIDATGTGDVTKTHEVWRVNGLTAGYSTPAVHDGKVYVCDNSANLHALSAASGKRLWRHSVGTVMKASPVVVDGKIYLGEVNSRFVILQPGEAGCKTLSDVTFPDPDGAIVEVNGSAAAVNGRIYFTSRDKLYCLGLDPWKGSLGTIPARPREKPAAVGEKATHLQVVPAEVAVYPGQSVTFSTRNFDSKGRLLSSPGNGGSDARVEWVVKGVAGAVTRSGVLTVAGDASFAGGFVEAREGTRVGRARVRVLPRLPFTIDFEDVVEGKPPAAWIGAGIKFRGASLDGEKLLKKNSKLHRFIDAKTYFALPLSGGYTLEADVMGTVKRRNYPNMGLINSRYRLLIMGNEEKLRILSWIPHPRVDRTIPFKFQPKQWYRMKFQVDPSSTKGTARAKVWPRVEKEPEEWTIVLDDPIPNPAGSPGVQAYSAGTTSRSPGADVYFDNVRVSRNP